MVVGNGLLARRFEAYQQNQQYVIFASGVSDSKSENELDYARELQLLRQTIENNMDATLVYFSTCSIADPSLRGNRYIAHKLTIEQLLQTECSKYLIFRISNVAGPGGNPKTIFHFLVQAVTQQQNFKVWKNAYRNLIDVDDVLSLIDFSIQKGERNNIFTIAHPISLPAPVIVQTIETYFGIAAQYELVDAGNNFFIDNQFVTEIAPAAGVNFEGNYLHRLLQKYYPIK